LKELQQALIISGHPQNFEGKNLIYGETGGTQIKISEITCSSRIKDEMGMQLHQHYFNGMAGISNYDTGIKDNILICSDDELAQSISSISRDAPVSHGHEKEFIIFYSKKKEYEKIVTPATLLKLKQYTDITYNSIIFSAFPEGLCIAIVKGKRYTYIRSKLLRSVLNEDVAKNYYTDILFMIDIMASSKTLLAQQNHGKSLGPR
jgi:hypothetical protein